MDVGTPELLAEHFELPVGPQIAGELVDREVEAHPPPDPIHRRKAQARGFGGSGAAVQDQLLHADLLLGIQRHRAQLALLGYRNVRIDHPPVVRAGRGEHQSLHAKAVCVGDERAGRSDVDVVRGLGIEGASRIADDRGQVHDLLGTRQGARAGLIVTHIGAYHLYPRPLLLAGDVLLTVKK